MRGRDGRPCHLSERVQQENKLNCVHFSPFGRSMRVLETLDRRGHLQRVDASGSIEEVFVASCVAFDTLAI